MEHFGIVIALAFHAQFFEGLFVLAMNILKHTIHKKISQLASLPPQNGVVTHPKIQIMGRIPMVTA
jgi:hypothetical protein